MGKAKMGKSLIENTVGTDDQGSATSKSTYGNTHRKKQKKTRRGGKRGGKKHSYKPADRLELSRKQPFSGTEEQKDKIIEPSKMPFAEFTTSVPKNEIKESNQQISLHAQRKQLRQATVIFRHLVETGRANKHTYAAIVNAHVRCGDVEGAAKCVDDMKAAGLRPCVVTYTTLLKGYCTSWTDSLSNRCHTHQLDLAWQILSEMSRYKIFPNVRTVNTFLRGCLITGDVELGFRAFCTLTSAGVEAAKEIAATASINQTSSGSHKKVKTNTATQSKDTKVLAAADASTFDYIIQLLCYSLRLQEAEIVLSVRQKKARLAIPTRRENQNKSAVEIECAKDAEYYNSILDDGSMLLHVARASAFLGKWQRCGRLLDQADAALFHESNVLEKGKEGDLDGKTSTAHGVLGGRRGGKRTAADVSRLASDRVFRAHRNEVLATEAAVLRTFFDSCSSQMAKRNHSKQKSISTTETNANESAEIRQTQRFKRQRDESTRDTEITVDLRPLFQRTLLFPPRSVAEVTSISLQKRLIDALGYNAYLKYFDAAPISPTTNSTKLKQDKEEIVPDFNVLDEDGLIRFKELFPHGGPIKVEIGAGTGEWATSQARAEEFVPNLSGTGLVKANWCSVEVRYDRVANMFSKVAFESAEEASLASTAAEQIVLKNMSLPSNLALICCDAFSFLRSHVAPRTLDGVFVNYPEPPQQRGGDIQLGDGASEGRHMLSEEFFELAHAALRKGGKLTIVTDNFWYARLLLRTAAAFCGRNCNTGRQNKKFSCPSLSSLCDNTHKSSGKSRNLDRSLPFIVKEELGTARIYSMVDGESAMHREIGHAKGCVSSYFDRLWRRDARKERFCLFLIAE